MSCGKRVILNQVVEAEKKKKIADKGGFMVSNYTIP